MRTTNEIPFTSIILGVNAVISEMKHLKTWANKTQTKVGMFLVI